LDMSPLLKISKIWIIHYQQFLNIFSILIKKNNSFLLKS